MSPIKNSSEAAYYRPALPITLSLMAGIILTQGLPGFVIAALFILIVAALRLAICLRRDRPARWSPLLATMAAGYLAMVPWLSPTQGPDHVAQYLDTGYWRIHGTVVDSPIVRFGRTRLLLDVNTLSREAVSQSVRGRIRLTVMGELNLDPGDRVAFPARMRAFRNFRNPGGFDYRRHMAFEGIHGSAWVQADKIRRIGKGTRSPATRLIHAARHRLAQMIDARRRPRRRG